MMEDKTAYCIPFAGGNKYSFGPFVKQAMPGLNVVPLEYPGRGSRIKEPLLSDTHQLAFDLFNQIRNQLDGSPYILYGHSMGACLVYELSHLLIKSGLQLPQQLLVSGATGPSAISRTVRGWHKLPKDQLLQKLRELDGAPPEILENEEFFEFFEPIIRADFKSVETYQYKSSAALNIPITVATGVTDNLNPEEIKLWEKESKHPVEFLSFSGGHFFLFDHVQELLNLMLRKQNNLIDELG